MVLDSLTNSQMKPPSEFDSQQMPVRIQANVPNEYEKTSHDQTQYGQFSEKSQRVTVDDSANKVGIKESVNERS
jgi:hypothetical protein